MKARATDRQRIGQLVEALARDGRRVVGPRQVDDIVLYAPLGSGGDLLWDANEPVPRNSLKQLVLPRTEPLLRYRIEGSSVQLEPASLEFAEQVVVCAAPCDAAALPILDQVFSWDYDDEPYQARRAHTTIISLGCQRADELCFCTAVGLGPASSQGTDLLLVPIGDSELEVRICTDRGAQLIAEHDELFDESPETTAQSAELATDKQAKPDVPVVQRWLEASFEHELWQQLGWRCLGCGACRFTCPTCHCFDIVDEPADSTSGLRRRNWDGCGFGLFTLHASGHNPRNTQPARLRQRVKHKFSYYPTKFGEILCTGCGRCGRACPQGLGMAQTLRAIEQEASRRRARAGRGGQP